MDEQLRIILIIIVSVSIFGLITFVFVRNYLKNIIIPMMTLILFILLKTFSSLLIEEEMKYTNILVNKFMIVVGYSLIINL